MEVRPGRGAREGVEQGRGSFLWLRTRIGEMGQGETYVDGRPVHDVRLESLVDLIYNFVRDRLPAQSV